MRPDEALSETRAAPPLARYFLWGVLVAALLTVLVAALLVRGFGGRADPPPELPVVGQVPDFELTNRDGRTVTRADLLGEPWIVDFIFTRCQVSCPVLTARMARIQSQWPGDDVRFVSISVDPVHDRPEVLEAFAQEWGAEERWWFLTGDLEAVYSLIRDGFKIGVVPPADGVEADDLEPITHSTKLALVDAEGRIRGYYDGMGSADEGRLLADLLSLVDRP